MPYYDVIITFPSEPGRAPLTGHRLVGTPKEAAIRVINSADEKNSEVGIDMINGDLVTTAKVIDERGRVTTFELTAEAVTVFHAKEVE